MGFVIGEVAVFEMNLNIVIIFDLDHIIDDLRG